MQEGKWDCESQWNTNTRWITSYSGRIEHIKANMSKQEFSGFDFLCEHMAANVIETKWGASFSGSEGCFDSIASFSWGLLAF